MKKFGLVFLITFITLFCCSISNAGVRLYGIASLGEAPYSYASDMLASTTLPQGGFSVEYSTKYLTPYSKSSIGKFNHEYFVEEYIGIQVGAKVFWVKPSLTFGAGIQSASEKRFSETDETIKIRRVYTPYGFGARLDVFDKVFTEFEGRANGLPWWKLEVGFRLF